MRPRISTGNCRQSRFAIDNAPRGLLKRIDSSVLEIWCKAHSLHRLATAEVEKTGLLVKTPTRDCRFSPLSADHQQAGADYAMRAIDHLGFSPVSRTRIMIGDGPGKAGGGWDEIEAAV